MCAEREQPSAERRRAVNSFLPAAPTLPRSTHAASMKRAHPEYSSSDSELDETIEVEKESADENG